MAKSLEKHWVPNLVLNLARSKELLWEHRKGTHSDCSKATDAVHRSAHLKERYSVSTTASNWECPTAHHSARWMETTRDHRWAELREDAMARQKARGSAKMMETASDHLLGLVRDRWKVQTLGQMKARS